MLREGLLPFTSEAFDRELTLWREQDYPAIHHSEAFRTAYRPAYRVIAKEYLPFLPLLAAIDGRGDTPTVVAVEGGSGSGKTTLSRLLESLYDCTVFHMDDFFLRLEQRTPQRFAEVGGNVDRERFLAEVLLPLHRGEPVTYRKFDCATMSLGAEETVVPKKLVIVEGAYAMHPELAQYYDLSVFLQITPEQQRQRILERNGPMAQRFFTEWIPLENRYFEQTHIINRCDLIIPIGETV
jgi:uridine kinase